MRREKIIQAILNWKFVYTFWAISYIGYFICQSLGSRYLVSGLPFLIYWGALNMITTIVGCYHACKRYWIDALLYFCLSLFPSIVTSFME